MTATVLDFLAFLRVAGIVKLKANLGHHKYLLSIKLYLVCDLLVTVYIYNDDLGY